MHSSRIKKMTAAALAAAVIAVSAMIAFPIFSLPVTLQSFAVLTVMGLFGAKIGGCALLLYLALGAVGLPVFAGFTGGFWVLLGPTGGFLWGFLFSVPTFFFCRRHALSVFLSVLFYLLIGSLWYYFGYARETSYFSSLFVSLLPFLLPESVKAVLAYFIAKKLKKLIRFT